MKNAIKCKHFSSYRSGFAFYHWIGYCLTCMGIIATFYDDDPLEGSHIHNPDLFYHYYLPISLLLSSSLFSFLVSQQESLYHWKEIKQT